MGALKSVRLRLRALLGKRAVERDLDDELRFHVDLETDKNIRAGMAPADARRRAALAFGGLEATKEAHRDGWGVRWIEDGLRDVRLSLRALARNPVLAGAAIVTLALGIGANTAIFSAVNAVILRPLPFRDPDRLVMLWEQNPDYDWYQQVAAPANVLDWRDQVSGFDDVAAYADFRSDVTLTGQGEPRLLTVEEITGNLFDVLGVRAALGRTPTYDETWKPRSQIVVISDRLWRTQFGTDPGIIGRSIVLNGRRVQVAGVMPPGFAFPSASIDAWSPFGWDPATRTAASFRRAHWLRAIARLAPGVTPEVANAQLQTVATRLQQQYPDTNRLMGAGLTPLHAFLIQDTREPLVILLAAVALLLLIACANVGNLLLVRATGREREAAVRLSLGAGRGRLIRQALTESLVLSALGGLAGLALGWWGTRALIALQPSGMLPVDSVPIAWNVLGYVVAITTGSGLLFGLAPAIWSGSRSPADAIKEGGRGGGAGRRMRRWGHALVVGEVAIAALLTVGAGLLIRSFIELQHVDPGFEPAGVLAVELNAGGARYDTPAKQREFWNRLVAGAAALPGVEGAAASARLPLTEEGDNWTSQFAIAGRGPDESGEDVIHLEVTPDYFHVMHIPVIRGRAFTPADTDQSADVVLINQALARQFFPGQDPVGQQLVFDKAPGPTPAWKTIVGVVGDVHQTSLDSRARIQIIEPFAQRPRSGMFLLVRTAGDPLSLAAPVRRVLSDIDPTLAITSLQTLGDVRATSLDRQRFFMTLLTVFAAVGLLLALVGVYGVMAQVARGRRREIGIRMALGGTAAQVRWLVVRSGLELVAAGLAVGLVGAFAATRVIQAFLFQITPFDPATFVAVPLLLLVSATLAAWLPAVRASRANPAVTLRED